MARTGRPRKPTSLIVLEGNRGHRPINDKEPQPEKTVPPCPKHIQGEARKEWRRITKELLSMNVISRVDRSPIEAYCAQYAIYHKAKAKFEELGEALLYQTSTGYPIATPYLGIMNTAYGNMCKFWQEFGLTAASRTRIRVEKPKKVDPFEAYKAKKKA